MKQYCVLLLAGLLGWCAVLAAQPMESVPKRIPIIGEGWESSEGSFSFVILGDKTSGGEGKWPIFDRAVDSINLLAPDFVITTGDQIPGHMEERTAWDAEWAEYFEHARRLQMPLILVPGNHDIANTQCYGFWQEDFGATYFYFIHKHCLFLVLNTEEERFDGRGPVWERMMVFGESALEKHTDVRHTFVFFHKPMWNDPRFLEDWRRIREALCERPFTVVAGNEHYLSTDYDDGNVRIILNATGGGVHLSEAKEFGCFHGFAHVRVLKERVSTGIMEPDGTLWPVDIAPASFRSAIDRDLVRLDADLPEISDNGDVLVMARALLKNPFDQDITLRLYVSPLRGSAWRLMQDDAPTPVDDTEKDACFFEVSLEPRKEQWLPLRFQVPRNALATPPAVTWEVQYNGHWLQKEPMRMEEVNVVPLYPASTWKDVLQWQIAGPFPVGDINTAALPRDPKTACPGCFHTMGPEQGYEPEAVYENDITWRPACSNGKGLLNHNALLGTADLAAAYNAFRVYSPEPQETHALVYADNFALVYLNGILEETAQAFNAPGGFVYVPLHLKAGWNRAVVKVINNRGDWFLRFLLADPSDNLLFSDKS